MALITWWFFPPRRCLSFTVQRLSTAIRRRTDRGAGVAVGATELLQDQFLVRNFLAIRRRESSLPRFKKAASSLKARWTKHQKVKSRSHNPAQPYPRGQWQSGRRATTHIPEKYEPRYSSRLRIGRIIAWQVQVSVHAGTPTTQRPF